MIMLITYISKENSLLLKGFALLLMVVLHLFMNEGTMKEAFCLCSIQNIPLATWLTRGCSPVGYFLFVSGYGLYYKHLTNSIGGGKIIRLYKLYWLSLVIFLPLAIWIDPDSYPGNWIHCLGSITAFRTYWNGEIWFLFPYVLLFITSKYVFRLLDICGSIRTMFISYVLGLCSMYLVSRYYTKYFCSHYAVYHVVLYFNCLFMFVMGALFCKCSKREFKGLPAKILSLPQRVLYTLFVMIFLSECIINFAPYTCLCQLALILLFLRINWIGIIKRSLKLFGHYSTVVWFVHTWICYYCFKDIIYNLHYPLLMLVVTMISSLAVGYIIIKLDAKIKISI